MTFPGATVGGLAAGSGNIIANNGTTGPFDQSGVEITSKGIPILSNSIYNNQKLGINLNGGNNGQVAPVLTSASTTSTQSTIAGTLTAAAGTYTLQFFSTPGLNPSGNAEGKTLLGTATVTIIGSSANFTETLNTPFTPGNLVTATATDSTGDTSEFSTGISGTQSPLPPTLAVFSSSSSVPVGQQVIDTFTINNPATMSAEAGIIFSDTIPANVAYVSGTTSTGVPVLFSNGVATADIGTLAAGQSIAVVITLSPTLAAGASFTDTGEVTATIPLVTAGEITASTNVGVDPSADLAVNISGPTSPVTIGQGYVYTVTATNNGPSPAGSFTITDVLPDTLTFVTASSSSGQIPIHSNGSVSDMVPSLAAGATEVLTIMVIPTMMSTPSVSNSAVVMTNVGEFDPDPTNDSATLVTVVNPVVDLSVVNVLVSTTPVTVGTTVTFTINVTNGGPSTATGVTVLDDLPAGLKYLTGTADGGAPSIIGGVISAPIGTLLAGSSSVVTIVAMATMAGTFTNIATVSSPQADSNQTNNTGSVSLTVTPLADLSVSLSGPSLTIYTGTMVTYSAVVTNNGPSDASNVLFADPLFAGASFVSVVANQLVGSVVNGVVELSLGTIAAGASVDVILRVIPVEPGVFTNTAFVSASEPDPDPANNSSSVSTAVIVPQSFITFASANYMVAENAGYVAINLDRSSYFQDDVTVHFSTFGGNATPGLDYIPTSEIVDFPAGSTQATVLVPVLQNPYDNHNEIVGLEIDSPTGSGVLLANPSTAALTIVDIDPLLVGPTVTALKLNGYVNSITSIEVDFTGALNPLTASNPFNYTITALGGPAKGCSPWARSSRS